MWLILKKIKKKKLFQAVIDKMARAENKLRKKEAKAPRSKPKIAKRDKTKRGPYHMKHVRVNADINKLYGAPRRGK